MMRVYEFLPFEPGFIYMSSMPPRIPAANLLLKGFQTRYSVEVAGASEPLTAFAVLETEIRFSP